MATRAEALKEIRAHIKREVAMGFSPDDDILESATEFAEDEYKEFQLSSAVPGILSKAIEEHVKNQHLWPEITDCDRLDAAFADLEKNGIVARQDFACCQTCGHAEIDDEISEAMKHNSIVGFTFYHHQDTQRATDQGELLLAYGGLDGEDESTLNIGRRIVACLKRHDLKVMWKEDVKKRIQVTLDWKRRRVVKG